MALILTAGGCASGVSAPDSGMQAAADLERAQAMQKVQIDPAIPPQAKIRILAAKPPAATPLR